jgi:acetylornithine deacetylase/succinyl-diaminopimelate desuccinylase-like protein
MVEDTISIIVRNTGKRKDLMWRGPKLGLGAMPENKRCILPHTPCATAALGAYPLLLALSKTEEMDISTVDAYIEANKDRFLDELIGLLRIPSVSADPAYAKDVHRAAALLAEQFNILGVDKVEICPTKGFPIVYGEKMVDAKLPTVLVYGHYDVQPADPLDLWHSPPFEPVIKDGKIYARGACDDKGQMYMHVKAVELMMKTDGLPCNVKFMIEGEEEVGSDNLGDFVKANKERLKADLVVISDTSMIANDVPSITVGLRGLSYLQVEVTGPNRDLHSGVYGGAVANPINVLCAMIASLHDEQKRITIPGFYDDVIEVTPTERAEMAKAPFNEKEYMADLDIAAVQGEEGYLTMERCTIRPTLDINGIWGGYIGEGAKTVLPSKAYAKLSCRLVPGQQPRQGDRHGEGPSRKDSPCICQGEGGAPPRWRPLPDPYRFPRLPGCPPRHADHLWQGPAACPWRWQHTYRGTV